MILTQGTGFGTTFDFLGEKFADSFPQLVKRLKNLTNNRNHSFDRDCFCKQLAGDSGQWGRGDAAGPRERANGGAPHVPPCGGL